jgi:digeranylgeranylglycerophospholipid reductase
VTSTRWDAVIVGGGFAGLAAAQAAATRGLRTLLLERKRVAGSGIHTTGLLAPDAVDALAPPSGTLGARLDAVELVGPSGKGRRFERVGMGFTPTRTGPLLESLAGRALAAGAEIRYGMHVVGALARGRSVAVVTDREIIEADHVVAADGARSAIAASLGAPPQWRMLAGAEVHAEVRSTARGGLERDASLLLVHREWAPGYAAWAFEGCDGRWQIGVLGRIGGGYRPDRALDAFLAWLERRRGFRPSRIVEHRGGLVPAGGARRFRHPRVVLAGDAGGHVSAVTAGGIGRAVQAGAALGWTLAGGSSAWEPILAEQQVRAGGHRVALAALHDVASLAFDECVVRLATSSLAAKLAEDVIFRFWPGAAVRCAARA